jgi:hypothetical protein
LWTAVLFKFVSAFNSYCSMMTPERPPIYWQVWQRSHTYSRTIAAFSTGDWQNRSPPERSHRSRLHVRPVFRLLLRAGAQTSPVQNSAPPASGARAVRRGVSCPREAAGLARTSSPAPPASFRGGQAARLWRHSARPRCRQSRTSPRSGSDRICAPRRLGFPADDGIAVARAPDVPRCLGVTFKSQGLHLSASPA